MRIRLAYGLTLLLFAFAARETERSAHACNFLALGAPTAFPSAGAVDVSQRSSIYVITASAELPQGLTLTANGQVVPLPYIDSLGPGEFGQGIYAYFWQLRTPLLLPSTTYVLSADEAATSRELTTFATAAQYDKPVGQAPLLTGLRLWRIRYPVERVGGGGCVFSEYEGYIDLNYQEGSVPGSPAEERIGVVNLHPKLGGPSQFFAFAGVEHFEAAPLWDSTTQSLVDVPEGELPSPLYAVWKPSLEPDREYCVSMTWYGRNQSGVPMKSNAVCAKVINVDARNPSGCQVGGKHVSGGMVAVALIGLLLVAGRGKRRYGSGN